MNADKILTKIMSGRYWHNIGKFCNRKTHPSRIYLDYRPYRRGKNRCLECGARIGKVKCIRKSYREQLIENIFHPTPTLNFLSKKLKESINKIEEFKG